MEYFVMVVFVLCVNKDKYVFVIFVVNKLLFGKLLLKIVLIVSNDWMCVFFLVLFCIVF